MNKVDHESVRVDVDEALKLGLGADWIIPCVCVCVTGRRQTNPCQCRAWRWTC